MVHSGLDLLVDSGFAALKGKKIGVVCHQASVDRNCAHILDLLLPGHRSGEFEIVSAFGPQHGIWGHTQDNMIEWEGYTDSRTGLRFYSLYGEHREPTPSMLEGIEVLIVDVQDVGARYYTFIWTLANCMKACAALGIKVKVLDRPNPIGGEMVEDIGWSAEYKSFVGLYKIAVRHGLTLGEVALMLKDKEFPSCEVEVVWTQGWSRSMSFLETGLPWALPSPNMPTTDTALVYPGQCLLEGTKLSEGRGTTKPFEIFGAPFVDAWAYCGALNEMELPGCVFRPVQFLPTFQKHQGEICQGAQIHVTDSTIFQPLRTTAGNLWTLRQMYGEKLNWQDPPYEYEEVLLPIDILAGGTRFRQMVDEETSWKVFEGWISDESERAVDEISDFRVH